MSDSDLDLRVVESNELTPDELEEIIRICSESFGADYRPYMDTFVNATHVIGYYEGKIVSHALWITRWLQAEDNPLMETAYVEAVVTDKPYRERGFASAVMSRLAEEVSEYELAALCTGFPEFYMRLGWQIWEGPLYIRTQEGMTPTLEEPVMILLLPSSPELDINSSLSAEWRDGELW